MIPSDATAVRGRESRRAHWSSVSLSGWVGCPPSPPITQRDASLCRRLLADVTDLAVGVSSERVQLYEDVA